jgi:hypothetical protein
MSATKGVIGSVTVLSGLVDLGLHLRSFSLPSLSPTGLTPELGAFATTGAGVLATTGTNIATSEILSDSVDRLDSSYKRQVGRQAILSSSVGVKILSQTAVLVAYGYSTADWATVSKYATEVLLPGAGASTMIALLAPVVLF